MCATAQSLPWLIAGRLIQGLGVCVGPTVGRAICRDLYEGKALARVLSLLSAIISVSPAVAPLAGGLLAKNLGWQSIFITLVAVGSLLCLIVHWLVPETAPSPGEVGRRRNSVFMDYKSLVTRQYVGFTMAGALVLAAWFIYVSSASFLYTIHFGLEIDEVGGLSLFTTIGYFLGSMSSMRLSKHILFRGLLGIGLCCCLTAGIALIFAGRHPELSSIPVIVGSMMVFSFGMGLTSPNSSGGAMASFRSVAGTASGVYGCTMMLLSAMATYLASLMGSFSIFSLGLLITFCVVLGMLSFLIIPGRRSA